MNKVFVHLKNLASWASCCDVLVCITRMLVLVIFTSSNEIGEVMFLILFSTAYFIETWCYCTWEESINAWWRSGHKYGFRITFPLPSALRLRHLGDLVSFLIQSPAAFQETERNSFDICRNTTRECIHYGTFWERFGGHQDPYQSGNPNHGPLLMGPRGWITAQFYHTKNCYSCDNL